MPPAEAMISGIDKRLDFPGRPWQSQPASSGVESMNMALLNKISTRPTGGQNLEHVTESEKHK